MCVPQLTLERLHNLHLRHFGFYLGSSVYWVHGLERNMYNNFVVDFFDQLTLCFHARRQDTFVNLKWIWKLCKEEPPLVRPFYVIFTLVSRNFLWKQNASDKIYHLLFDTNFFCQFFRMIDKVNLNQGRRLKALYRPVVSITAVVALTDHSTSAASFVKDIVVDSTIWRKYSIIGLQLKRATRLGLELETNLSLRFWSQDSWIV